MQELASAGDTTEPPDRPAGRGTGPGATTQRVVWARAGGICSYPGCGTVLYEDPASLTMKTFGELAHNVAASARGPRGDHGRSRILSDDPDNLILFCPTHHALVDKPGWEITYPEAVLAQWKRQHEAAIRLAGRCSHGQPALALGFLGVIGRQPAGISLVTSPRAAFERGLVLDAIPPLLHVDARAYPPRSAEYWHHVATEVRRTVELLQGQVGGPRRPIAVFAVADMPALMALGFGLGHGMDVYPFQWDRYGRSWAFPESDVTAVTFRCHYPESWDAPVALVLSLSAPIEPARVHAAFLAQATAIVELTVDAPCLDLVRGPATLEAFRTVLAEVLSTLERKLPKATPIHVFPALPASLAVAFGAAIKPKVSFPFRIYDAEGPGGPFTKALLLPSPPAGG